MRRLFVLILPLLFVASGSALGQATGSISGAVTGTTGQPLVGAAVRVVGTNVGATTGPGGRYTISNVPAGTRTVQTNFAGYQQAQRSVTVAAGAVAPLNIQLILAAVEVEGVVAIGYGTTRRQDVTGSLATVEMEGMENRPIQSVTQALIGQIPGVRVVTMGGTPGSAGLVQIRGLSAVGAGSTPLYVIDGFPMTAESANGANAFAMQSPLTDIPPSEIESITVLKDASATAIYGSQASNGVILVTTKRGRAAAPQITINARYGLQTPMWDRLMDIANGTEFATYMNRRARQLLWIADGAKGKIPGPTDPRIDARWQNPERYGEGTDWYRQVISSQPTTDVTAALYGGNQQVRVALSGGYLGQVGLVEATAFKRGNLRANLDANIGSRLKVALSIAPTYSVRNILSQGGDGRNTNFGSVLQLYPTDSPRDSLGRIKPFVQGGTGGTVRNPLSTAGNVLLDNSTFNTLFNTAVDVTVLEGVTFRSQFNARMTNESRMQYNPSTITNANDLPVNPDITTSHSTATNWLSDNTLNINRTIGEAHVVGLLFGASAQRNTTEGTDVNKNAGSFFLPDDLFRQIDIISGGSTNWSSWTMASVFGRLNYTLLDRYNVTGTLRTDGSSRFGAENRWGTFPSVAVGWSFAREPFLESVTFLTDGKVRASLGWTGNSQIGNFSSFGQVTNTNSNYNFGSGITSLGRGIGSLSNPVLGWERTREVNLGLDLDVFRGRVSFTSDLYRRQTENLLISRALPTSSGFGSVTSNLGSIQNQGVELQLITRNVQGPRFRWDTNVSLAMNRNKAIDLGESDTLYSGGSQEGAPTHITVVGQPIGRFVGYRITGIYTPEDMKNVCVVGNPTPGCTAIYSGAVVTDVKFKDVNGDGVIRQTEDFEVLGNPWPEATWGLTNTLGYGPLTFRATMDGQIGGQVLNRSLSTTENIDGPFNVTKKYVQGMFVDFDSIGDGMTPAAGSSSTGGRRAFRDVTDRWLMDSGFIWLRNLQLDYDLPARIRSPLGARSGGVYISVENPWLSTPCECNPQTSRNTGNPNLQPGFDDFSYPLARLWTLGFNLGL